MAVRRHSEDRRRKKFFSCLTNPRDDRLHIMRLRFPVAQQAGWCKWLSLVRCYDVASNLPSNRFVVDKGPGSCKMLVLRIFDRKGGDCGESAR